jgi:hypothetical protein
MTQATAASHPANHNLDRAAADVARAWTGRTAGDAFEVAFEEARQRLQAGEELTVHGVVYTLTK